MRNEPITSPVGKKVSKPKKGISPEISSLIASINKKHGDNTIRVGFGDHETIERIPTGSFSLDIALGGGIPVGRMTLISGALSSTKTTQVSHIIKNAQNMGLVCMFVDVEGTTTEDYLVSLGVDVDSLLYIKPDSLEEATEIILTVQKSGLAHLAVLDSIAALSSNKEQESAMDETVRMGVTPQLYGEFCRKYQMNNNRLSREGNKEFTLIMINQLREKIGAYGD